MKEHRERVKEMEILYETFGGRVSLGGRHGNKSINKIIQSGK